MIDFVLIDSPILFENKQILVLCKAAWPIGTNETMRTSRASLENNIATPTLSSSSSFGLLDLFLGGRSKQPPEVVWEFLTVQELVNLRCVSRSYRARLEEHFEYNYSRDGNNYTVPYPGFPGLLRHCDAQKDNAATDNANGNAITLNEHNRAGLYPHQLASLRAMHQMENNNNVGVGVGGGVVGAVPFGALRGGVLGDAPGLGKTITTLALISSTAGRRPVNPPEFWDTTGIHQGWRAFRTNPEARTEVLRCLKPIRHKLAKEELRKLEPPFNDDNDGSSSSNSNRNNNNNNNDDRDIQFPTLKSFEQYIRGLLRGNKRRQEHGYRRRQQPIASRAEWELVRRNLLELQIGMDKRNRKLKSSQAGQRLLWERELIPTSATLLVVPDALFEHWFQQIQEHLYLPVFADDDEDEYCNDHRQRKKNKQQNSGSKTIVRGVVYLDGLGDLADVTVGEKALENTSALKEPVLFADQLSGYLIVIVTFSRCRKEVRSGHADANTNANANNNETRSNRRQNSKTETNNIKTKKKQRQVCAPALPQSTKSLSIHRSPLLKLRWLRLMIDEGHQLETDNDLSEFIHQVAAERRWVISGTPVTGNEDNPEYNSTALDQLQRILYFLRHPRYGISKSRDVVEAWETEVKKPFLSRKSRKNLLGALKEIMVMHRKEDLKLPEPIFCQIEQEVDVPHEVEASITANQTNGSYGSLMIPYALDAYLHSPEFQSLVDDAQATYVVEAMRNARAEFCRTANPQNRPIKGVVYSSSNKDLLSVSDSILRKVYAENVAELYGDSQIGDMSAELERFRHGNKMYRTCPICKGENGMTVSRCSNDLMEVVSTTTRQRFLIEPERVLATRNVSLHRLGGEPMSNYSVNRKFWRVGDELVIDIRESHPLLPKRESNKVWKKYGAKMCKGLAYRHQYLGTDWYFGPLPDNRGADSDRPIEMEVVLKKWQKCGVFHSRSRWYQGPKFLDGQASKRKEDVFLLCLDADLAHGLDLSFVTHIFLLEAINDAALLEQVTSRAHRLGATGPVRIETIHVFYKCSEGFQQKLLSSLSSSNEQRETGDSNNNKRKKNRDKLSLIQGNQNRKASLNKIVCHHCYRQFDSKALAEEHERTLCPRNPENAVVADKYHLSSAYKEIRPPLPMVSSPIEVVVSL